MAGKAWEEPEGELVGSKSREVGEGMCNSKKKKKRNHRMDLSPMRSLELSFFCNGRGRRGRKGNVCCLP